MFPAPRPERIELRQPTLMLFMVLILCLGMAVGFGFMTKSESSEDRFYSWVGIPLMLFFAGSILRRVATRAPEVVMTPDYIEIYRRGRLNWNIIERVSVREVRGGDLVELVAYPHLNPIATNGLKARARAVVGRETYVCPVRISTLLANATTREILGAIRMYQPNIPISAPGNRLPGDPWRP